MSQDFKLQTAVLIDDDDVDLMLNERVIKRSGLVDTVLKFSYAEDALDFLRNPNRQDVDVIFLDINMPRMTGFEFLQEAFSELGEDFAKLIVVMLTTSLADKDREQAEQYEVVKAFFNKPLTADHLAEVCGLLATPQV